MKTLPYIFLLLIAGILPEILLAQFSQQGTKLVGTGGSADASQGSSVAISSDGNTAIIGGVNDDFAQGAVWVFTRNAGVWAQQGAKLVGSGSIGSSYQGYSVAISADGNTIIEGGWKDNNDAGAAWIFSRSGGLWSQQGTKLVGSGAVGNTANQGYSVAISSDGNTAFLGGKGDNNYTGAVWVFTRNGSLWTQQGAKLVGTGKEGQSNQGFSVSASSNGNTCIEGGTTDNGNIGASWIFTRSGGIWTQQGSKIVGSGANGESMQGYSVDISSDGNTAITGGTGDLLNQGSAWIFTRNGDVWNQQGGKLSPEISASPDNVGWSVAVTPDGNTAAISSPGADFSTGKVWIYTRSGSVWTKQNSALVGIGAVGAARQGWSVDLSADGTLIHGGPYDNNNLGAAWIFHTLTLAMPTFPGIQTKLNLEQNYPNPFASCTKIKFRISQLSDTKLTVYDLMGKSVSIILNKKLSPGAYEVDFDGSRIPKGTYFYKLETNDLVETKKMIIVR